MPAYGGVSSIRNPPCSQYTDALAAYRRGSSNTQAGRKAGSITGVVVQATSTKHRWDRSYGVAAWFDAMRYDCTGKPPSSHHLASCVKYVCVSEEAGEEMGGDGTSKYYVN